MYNSDYGDLEFCFHLRSGKHSLFILDRDNGERVFTVVDPDNNAHNLNWDSSSIPSVQDVRIWILLGMPNLPSKKPMTKEDLKILSKERLLKF